MKQNRMRLAMACLLMNIGFSQYVFATPPCEFQDVSPQTGNIVQIRELEISLGEASNEESPTAWEGPIIVKKNGAYMCSFGLNIIESPLTLVAERYLYVPTYSGSDRVLTVLDLKQCRTAWQSPVYYGTYDVKKNGVYVKGRKLKLNKSCLPPYEFNQTEQRGLTGG